jgi:hypothetical protein
MFLTNSAYFLNFKMHNTVKSIFSVSTDKAIDPTSMLGISKKLMEHTLYEIRKKNKKIIVSSSRFTNVSFSNGSILKHVMERFYQDQKIGLPANIKRYFITHDEAISLCLKALTKQSKNFIILPSDYSLKKALSIKKISFQILKILEKKYQLNYNLKNLRFEKSPTQGQKINEDIRDIDEVYQNYDKSKKILKTAFIKNKYYKKIIEDIFKSKTRAEFDKIAKKISKNYRFKNQKKVSEIL